MFTLLTVLLNTIRTDNLNTSEHSEGDESRQSSGSTLTANPRGAGHYSSSSEFGHYGLNRRDYGVDD